LWLPPSSIAVPEPRFLVLDEPTSAFDVSVQAQVIDLLMELKAQLKLSYLFISYNLSLVEYVWGRTLVLYAGRAAEFGQSSDLRWAPLHPYTQALLSSLLEPTAAPLETQRSQAICQPLESAHRLPLSP
jgi:peptide/nickel transport system ATP-binding protein